MADYYKILGITPDADERELAADHWQNCCAFWSGIFRLFPFPDQFDGERETGNRERSSQNESVRFSFPSIISSSGVRPTMKSPVIISL
jgi:hypothetical protein